MVEYRVKLSVDLIYLKYTNSNDAMHYISFSSIFDPFSMDVIIIIKFWWNLFTFVWNE